MAGGSMAGEAQLKEILFPHESVRKTQDIMLGDVKRVLEKKQHVLLHAPTGIGKTVSTLAPALSFALKKDLTIFFLTSRQTQHKIAVETLKQIKKKHGSRFSVVDLIAKKGMCLQEVEAMHSSEFLDHCKKLRYNDECNYYLNTRSKSKRPTVEAENKAEELRAISPLHAAEMISECKEKKLCPYEMASLMARDAKVIIADYNHMINESMREGLLLRANKKLEECIIIIDEAHNLPNRARDHLTSKLSDEALERAVKEARKYSYSETGMKLKDLKEVVEEIGRNLNFNTEEKLVRKHEFFDAVNERHNYEELITELAYAGDEIREKQKQSHLSSAAKFLEAWMGSDEGFARIMTKDLDSGKLTLSYRCLDPSLLTRDIITRSYATIAMSGTLTPTYMYRDILGFPGNSEEKSYENPFPEENRLCMVIPETTTKYSRRGEEEYKKIANACSRITRHVPGNTALFFPSYELRDRVFKEFHKLCNKKVVLERGT